MLTLLIQNKAGSHLLIDAILLCVGAMINSLSVPGGKLHMVLHLEKILSLANVPSFDISETLDYAVIVVDNEGLGQLISLL